MIDGKKVMIIRVATRIIRKGMSRGTTSSIEVLLIPQATYKQIPTGGEIMPMPTLAATKMPKCTGSIPLRYAMEAMVDFMLQSALRLVHPQEILLLGLGGMGLFWGGGLAIGGGCTVERLCGCAGKICRQEWRHGTPGGVRHVKVECRLRR